MINGPEAPEDVFGYLLFLKVAERLSPNERFTVRVVFSAAASLRFTIWTTTAKVTPPQSAGAAMIGERSD